MSFQPPRRPRALASALAAAGILLAGAGCDVAPIGPAGPTSTTASASGAPHPVGSQVLIQQLGSPIILQVMRSQPALAAGKCPAGYVTIPAAGSAGTCYQKLGQPATITHAAVSSVSAQGQPPSYVFMVVVPPAEQAAVTAAIKQAYDVQGALAVEVAGQTWSAPHVVQPFPGQQLQIAQPSRSLALRLYHLLIPPG
jgi:hypothetical protein